MASVLARRLTLLTNLQLAHVAPCMLPSTTPQNHYDLDKALSGFLSTRTVCQCDNRERCSAIAHMPELGTSVAKLGEHYNTLKRTVTSALPAFLVSQRSRSPLVVEDSFEFAHFGVRECPDCSGQRFRSFSYLPFRLNTSSLTRHTQPSILARTSVHTAVKQQWPTLGP